MFRSAPFPPLRTTIQLTTRSNRPIGFPKSHVESPALHLRRREGRKRPNRRGFWPAQPLSGTQECLRGSDDQDALRASQAANSPNLDLRGFTRPTRRAEVGVDRQGEDLPQNSPYARQRPIFPRFATHIHAARYGGTLSPRYTNDITQIATMPARPFKRFHA